MTLLGAVLAGGRSRRFGSDKALALLDGRPLIEHAVQALASLTDAVVVCGRRWGNGDGDWVPDRPTPELGPLGGINAALHVAAARGFAAVLTCPCDVPSLPGDLVERLGAGPAYLAQMPVIGLWPAALAGGLDDWLARSEDRSVRGWAGWARADSVALDRSIPNINTPEALDRFDPY